MKFIKIKYFVLTVLLLSCINSNFALNAEKDSVKAKLNPKIEFKYLKNSDGSKSLICIVRVTLNENVVPLKNVILDYYTGNDLSASLGSTITDFKGKAICKVPSKFNLQTNEESKYSFKAEYKGNDTIEAASEEIQIMDATMEMTCNDADSIKSITVRMFRNEKGKIIPLKDEKVIFYIPRMFSMLQIGEAKLDSAGYASFDFPANLPGDSLGNLTIISKLEDHSAYGNIEKSDIRKWGIATTKELLLEQRALWSQVAPVWMIVTLTIMLLGVWAHYLYVVIHMIMIFNKGKEHKLKTGSN